MSQSWLFTVLLVTLPQGRRVDKTYWSVWEKESSIRGSLIFLYLFGMSAFREYTFSILPCCEFFKSQFALGETSGCLNVPMIEWISQQKISKPSYPVTQPYSPI